MSYQKVIADAFPATVNSWNQMLMYLILGTVAVVTFKGLTNTVQGVVVGLNTVLLDILPFVYIAWAWTLRESRAAYYQTHVSVFFFSALLYFLTETTNITTSTDWIKRGETIVNSLSAGLLKGSVVAVVLNFP